MVLKGKNSIFEQIVDNYKRLIISKTIQNGEYLPSCRELAKELGVNPNTVARAYAVLEEEKFVTVLPKKGAYVSYGEDGKRNLDELKRHLNELRNEGFTKEEIEKALNEVFEGDK